MSLQTEFPFTLPRGYVDADGNLHREGVMRLATAFDEIAPHEGPARAGQRRVPRRHPAVARGRRVSAICPSSIRRSIEGCSSPTLRILQDLYTRINENGHGRVAVTCPHCQGAFDVEVGSSGG